MVLPLDMVRAALHGDLSALQAWLEADAARNVNDVYDDPGPPVGNFHGCGLLFAACSCVAESDQGAGAFDLVEYLVAQGANVHHRPPRARGGTGPTPLHRACKYALCGVVAVLVQAGADVNARVNAPTWMTLPGDDAGAAPLGLLFDEAVLHLRARNLGEIRDTGEVLEDMASSMIALLKAGAALDFVHVDKSDPEHPELVPTTLEDVIKNLMYSGWAAVENLPQRTFTCPPDDVCREYDDTTWSPHPSKRFLYKEWDGQYYAVEVPRLVRPGMKFEAHPEALGSLTTCLDLAQAVRASMYTLASSRLTPWRQYVLAPRLELMRLRSLVAQSRASSKLKRSLRPPRPATKSDRKFDCTTQAGVLDALAQTAPAPAPTGRTIIPPPRQSYKQRPLSIAESRRVYAEMRHIEWLMAPQTPNELVWRVLAYWRPESHLA